MKFKKIDQLNIFFDLKRRNEDTFGSINCKDIIKKVKEYRINIKKENFINFKNLHKIGNHIVKIKINKDLIAEIIVTIQAKEEIIKNENN